MTTMDVMKDIELELNDGTSQRCDIEYDIEDQELVLGRILYTGTSEEITEEQYDDPQYLSSLIFNYVEYLEDSE